MTQDEVIAWLRQGRDLQKHIESLERSKADAFARATGSPAPDGSVRGGSGVSRKAERFAILSAEVDRQLAELDRTLARITRVIGLVPDPTLRAILQDRYVRGMHWSEIARHVGYSDVHVHRLHHEALLAVQNVMECYSGSVV